MLPRTVIVLGLVSLLNDASGLVCFRFAVAAALTRPLPGGLAVAAAWRWGRPMLAGVATGVGTVRADQWAFADCRAVPFPGTPDPTQICVKGGFDPAKL